MSNDSTPTPGGWDETLADHKTRQAERIGKVALELAAEHGIANVSMRQLASAVGIARQTLYNYVPDVASAIAGYLATRAEAFEAHLDAALNNATDPAARLRCYVNEVLDYLASDEHRIGAAQLLAAGATGAHAESLANAQQRLHTTLLGILTDGIHDKNFRSDLDPEFVASLIEYLVAGAGSALRRQTTDPDSAAGTVIALIDGGLIASTQHADQDD